MFKQNFTNWHNKEETTSLVKPKKISTGGEGREERGEKTGTILPDIFDNKVVSH